MGSRYGFRSGANRPNPQANNKACRPPVTEWVRSAQGSVDCELFWDKINGRKIREGIAITQFFGAFSGIQWQDLADILLITFILYRLYLWIQGTRALRILIALAALGLLYFLARWFGLVITTWILQYLWAVILVIVVVIFQSEIRQVLERMSPVRFFIGRPEALDRLVLEEVVRTVLNWLKNDRAFMVFQRRDILEDYLKGGIPLGGRVSYEVLTSIFLPNSPAHDGAVVIHEGQIVSVGCYLPLSDNMTLPRNYGTRHRAGMGVAERGDAVSLIVSEERGEVCWRLKAGSGGWKTRPNSRASWKTCWSNRSRTKGRCRRP